MRTLVSSSAPTRDYTSASYLNERRTFFAKSFAEHYFCDRFFYIYSEQEKDVFFEEFDKQQHYDNSDLYVSTKSEIHSSENFERYKTSFPQSLDAEYFVVLDGY